MRISDWCSDVCSSDLEVEFLNARLVGGDRRTLHADAVFLDHMRRIDRDLIVGLVTLLDREVVIFEPDIEIGRDQALAKTFPDDPRHIVAVDLDDGGFDLEDQQSKRLKSRAYSTSRMLSAE